MWMTLLCRFQRSIPSFSALEPLIFALCSPIFASNQDDRTVSVVHTSWQLLVLRRSWSEPKVGEPKVGELKVGTIARGLSYALRAAFTYTGIVNITAVPSDS